MKTPVDIEALEKRIDFESVSHRLDQLSESGELKSRKTVGDLLARIEPALLRARERRVSYGTLARFLRENGIAVSEPTLRQYLKARREGPGERKGKRGRKSKKAVSVPEAEKKTAPEPEPKTGGHGPEWSERKTPPRLARRG